MIDFTVLALTLQQQFSLKLYQDQVELLSEDEAKELLVQVLRQQMVKDNLIKDLIKRSF